MSQPTLRPQVQAAIEASARLVRMAPSSDDPIESARIAYRQIAPLGGNPEPIKAVKNHLVDVDGHQIAIRIYNPYGGIGLPAVVFFHGGWFIAGDLETHDRPLRALANAADCIVVAVNYRLAPEHPFPAAIEDGLSVLEWIAREGAQFDIDANRLFLAGDSAGGAIATVLARKAAGIPGLRVLLQILIYPVTDPSLQSASWLKFAEGPVIDIRTALQAWQMYTPDLADRQNADAAPILASDLANSPSALIIVGEYDPLHDEGIAYAGRLQQAGVKVKTSAYKGMPHGFFQMAGYIDEGKLAIEEVAYAINEVLNG
jgi:acetyl esterase